MIGKIKGKTVWVVILGWRINLLMACHPPLDKTIAAENEENVLKATFLKVGKADAIVIQEGKKTWSSMSVKKRMEKLFWKIWI